MTRLQSRTLRDAAVPLTGSPTPRPSTDAPTPITRRWTLVSDLALIEPVVQAIVSLCTAAGFSARHCNLNVPVAVTEAMANAMLRGNGSDPARSVQVSLVLDTQRLLVEVIDEGSGFDLSLVQQGPDDVDWFEREDGRGVFLMRSLMDHVENAGPDAQAGHGIRLILHRT